METRRRYLVDGEEVPGVTTVLSVVAKPALPNWANGLGLRGVALGPYLERTAEVGTLTHALISRTWRDDVEVPSLPDDREALAAACHGRFLEWLAAHRVEPVLVEEPLVSRRLLFGGTPDLLARVDGELEVVDFKTSGQVYREHLLQVAAYTILAREHGYRPLRARVVQLGRDSGTWGEEILEEGLSDHQRAFLRALALYRALERCG